MNFAGLVDYIWSQKMKYNFAIKKCLEVVNKTKQYFINYVEFPFKSLIDWTLLYWSGRFSFRNRENHTVPNLVNMVVDRGHLLRFWCQIRSQVKFSLKFCVKSTGLWTISSYTAVMTIFSGITFFYLYKNPWRTTQVYWFNKLL